MGRSVEVGSDTLASYKVYLDEEHISVCQECDREVRISDYGMNGPEWELAYGTLVGKPAARLCYPEGHDDEDAAEMVHKGREYDSDDWQWDVEFYAERLKEMFPSLWDDAGSPSNSYLRETSVILRNALVEVRVSEYAGVTAFSFAPVEGLDYDGRTGLAVNWFAQIEPKLRALFGK